MPVHLISDTSWLFIIAGTSWDNKIIDSIFISMPFRFYRSQRKNFYFHPYHMHCRGEEDSSKGRKEKFPDPAGRPQISFPLPSREDGEVFPPCWQWWRHPSADRRATADHPAPERRQCRCQNQIPIWQWYACHVLWRHIKQIMFIADRMGPICKTAFMFPFLETPAFRVCRGHCHLF